MSPKRRKAITVGLRRVKPKLGRNSMLTRGRRLSPKDVEDDLSRSVLPDRSNAIELQSQALFGGGRIYEIFSL